MPIFIDDVITSIEVELDVARRTRDKAGAEVKYILKSATDAGRATLTKEEDTRVTDLFSARKKALAQIGGIESKLDQARQAKADELELQEAARESADTPGLPRPATDRQRASVTIGREERTYRADMDRKGVLFLQDVSRAFLFNDPTAQHRLSQHMAEERIERAEYMQRAAGDSTTTNWAGLTVPQYLTDMYAPAVAALRPFADICNHHDLPSSGMTVNISQVTTPTAVSNPATELPAAGVAAQSIDDTLLTENVQTAAGQATLSRQAIDRGTGIEEVTMQDLFRRYATNLDTNLLNQAVTGLSALATGTQVAFTSGAPTAQLMYPKILGATANVEAALLAQAIPSHVIMHSRRWYWLSSQLGTSWPLINSTGIPTQAGGTMDGGQGYNQGIRGRLPMGLGVVVDNNVVTNLGAGTNQDEVYVVARDECHLWEDPQAPVFIRAEQPPAARLGVLLVLYGYYAYTLRRYVGAVQSIGGTGFVTPTF